MGTRATSTVFDLLIAVGLTVIARTRHDGTTDGDALWGAAFTGHSGAHIAALGRRARYLAQALDPVTSETVLSGLVRGSYYGSRVPGCDDLPMIEVLDAGPPGQHRR